MIIQNFDNLEMTAFELSGKLGNDRLLVYHTTPRGTSNATLTFLDITQKSFN